MVKEGINNKETRYWLQMFGPKELESGTVVFDTVNPVTNLNSRLAHYLYSLDEDGIHEGDTWKVTLEVANFEVGEEGDAPDGRFTYSKLTTREGYRVLAERTRTLKDGNIIRTEKIFDPEMKEDAINYLKGAIKEDTDLLHRIENA
jgi:hypothetical protein